MADVFISYSRETKDRVRLVARALEADGYSVWWDAELPTHRTYADVIDEQIRAAKAVVVVWSKAALSSQWVRAEADRARNAGKLVQTTIERVIPPLPFDQIHAADLTNWNGNVSDERWSPVRDSVATLVRAGPRPAPRARVSRTSSGFSPLPALLGLGAIVAIGAAVYFVVLPRLSAPAAGPPAQETTVDAPAAPDASATANAPASRLAAGVDHRLEIPAGHTFDLDSGTVSDRIVDGSDFVIAEIGGGDWFLDQTTEASGSRPDTQGTPSRALCTVDEYFYRSYLADPGEYNCFRTDEGREGALIRNRDRPGFNGVIITYRFWE